MQNRKQLEKDINLIASFKGLAQAYEEISVNKMQKIRGKVLSSRDFLTDLSSVFADVKASYRAEIEQLIKRDKKGKFSYVNLNKNGKSISVLLSSNNKLYGDIGKKVYRLFVDDIKNNNSDIYIIGKVGKELFDQSENKRNYKYLDFPDNKEAVDKFSEVLIALEGYQNVNVYHGQFVNVITQNPIATNVTGTSELEKIEGGNAKPVKFYFEPSLEEVLTIFESQIFGSLFRQTLHESELSHVTSRIQQMEYALENIDSYQKDLSKKRKLVIKRQESAKRLQKFAGISLWR